MILKYAKGKTKSHIKSNPLINICLLSEDYANQKAWTDILQVLRKHRCQCKLPSLANLTMTMNGLRKNILKMNLYNLFLNL